MTHKTRYLYVALVASLALFLTSCYPAHSGSGSSSLSGGGSGGSGGSGGGGGNNGTPSTFTIGGSVIGLAGTAQGLVLEDNGSDDLTITTNGKYTFKIAVSGLYSVTVKTQPAGPVQSCTILNPTGTAKANITNVIVNCGTSGLTIGGTVSGLIGGGLVLQNNGGDNFGVAGTGNVPFTFATPVSAGTAYAVTVLTQPSNPAQVCSVVNGSGTANSNIGNVQVICTQPGFAIGGSVVGLVEAPGDMLELQDNAGDDLFVTGDTVFTFPTKVTNGGIYNVNVFLPPTSQPQVCNTFFYTGIATGTVTDIVVDCQHNDWNWHSYYVNSTDNADNYASVITPLFPANEPFPLNVSTPGGRDFATTWTDKQGRMWLFGGLGYPYLDPILKQLPGFLNDLWVYDQLGAGGWVPANLDTFLNTQPIPSVWNVRLNELLNTYVPTNVVKSPFFPGSRWGSSSWLNKTSGDLYLFGGQGVDSNGSVTLLNDVWKCTPGASVDANGAGTASCPWVLVGGSTVGNPTGAYGAQGTAGGVPGGRWAAATTTDAAGNIWLFGGQGLDSAGTIGLLNDLWEYNTTSNQWTWIGPSPSNIANQKGSYGSSPGAGTGTTAPGGRQAAVLWADTTGNIWLFGGFGLDSAGTGSAGPPPAGAILNDLWEYNISTKQWVWVSGNNLANQTGVYGSQATSNLSTGAATNVPGSRWGAVGWSDPNSNLWFFGGWGYGTSTTDPTGFLNDVWEYQQSSKQWIWWKGNSNANQNGTYAAQGIDFVSIPFYNDWAGARRGAALWPPNPPASGYVFMFGGEGYDASQGAPPGYLNDLWTYLPFPN